jgi:hypothetical protein
LNVSKSNDENIPLGPTYVALSVRHKKVENNDSNITNENKLDVNDYPTYQVKKRSLLKRLFSKN